MNNNPFVWDDKSDQPFIIQDKEYKKMMRKKNLFDYIPLLISNLFIFPLAIVFSFLYKGKVNNIKNFFGMSVNLDKGEEQQALINELGCKNILIRLPLSDIANIDKYVEFAKSFKDCKVLINILQNRENIDDKELLNKNIKIIFTSFKGISNEFQVANAINRTKWGFFSVKEYLEFYKVVYDIKKEFFNEYILLGPSVIDFEYHYTIRALFNKFDIYFDKVSALLYVDRRGAPENTQMISFDTIKKIDFLYTLVSLSKLSSNKVVITEVNWPLSNTKPYAPTSEHECISEEEYAQFMLRYYLLALGTKKIETVYWHQLIAPGYGLIDSRKGNRKRDAFKVYKVMMKFLQESEVLSYKNVNGLHVLTCKNNNKKLEVIWLSSPNEIPLTDFDEVYDMFGNKLEKNINISEKPIYAYCK